MRLWLDRDDVLLVERDGLEEGWEELALGGRVSLLPPTA